MHKLKTNKSITKRFRVTRNKKVLFRPLNQNHLNAKDSGDETRRKKGVKKLKGGIRKKILKSL